MFEIITVAALLIYLIVGHVTLVKRVKHLEKIVRWVEIQSNNNAVNINAISSMHDSELYAKNNSELADDEISAMQSAIRSDTKNANAVIRDRTEYLKSLGVTGEYIY